MKATRKLQKVLFNIISCSLAVLFALWFIVPLLFFGDIDLNIFIYIIIAITYWIFSYLLWKRIFKWFFKTTILKLPKKRG